MNTEGIIYRLKLIANQVLYISLEKNVGFPTWITLGAVSWEMIACAQLIDFEEKYRKGDFII